MIRHASIVTTQRNPAPPPARPAASPSSPITIAHSKFTEPSFCSHKYFYLQTIETLETSRNIVVLKHFDLAATAAFL